MKKLLTLIIALMAFAVGTSADNRTRISLVEGTSTNLTTIPVAGTSFRTKPTITVTKGAPAYFCIDNANGWW